MNGSYRLLVEGATLLIGDEYKDSLRAFGCESKIPALRCGNYRANLFEVERSPLAG